MEPKLKSIRFFIKMLTAFFDLVKPASKRAKPACMNITSIAAIRTQTVSRATDLLSMAWALVAMVGPSPSARAKGATSPVIKKTRNIIINTFRIICYSPISNVLHTAQGKSKSCHSMPYALRSMPHSTFLKRPAHKAIGVPIRH